MTGALQLLKRDPKKALLSRHTRSRGLPPSCARFQASPGGGTTRGSRTQAPADATGEGFAESAPTADMRRDDARPPHHRVASSFGVSSAGSPDNGGGETSLCLCALSKFLTHRICECKNGGFMPLEFWGGWL